MLTAGHCINNCNSSRFVFNYALTPAGTLPAITSDDVYRCVEFITYAQSQSGLDYTVVRLDRPVVGREPAPVRLSTAALPIGAPLLVAGFPGGLPLKIADNASVRSNHPALQHFVSNLDTFRGNSGSGVFDATTQDSACASSATNRAPVSSFPPHDDDESAVRRLRRKHCVRQQAARPVCLCELLDAFGRAGPIGGADELIGSRQLAVGERRKNVIFPAAGDEQILLCAAFLFESEAREQARALRRFAGM